MHEWMWVDLRFICMRVYSSAFLHLMQEGRVCVGVGGAVRRGWVRHRRAGGWSGGGGRFVGSGRSTPSRGLNAGVIKEQLQGCMDTRQSRPNEVSIGRIGAHAWTKAS